MRIHAGADAITERLRALETHLRDADARIAALVATGDEEAVRAYAVWQAARSRIEAESRRIAREAEATLAETIGELVRASDALVVAAAATLSVRPDDGRRH